MTEEVQRAGHPAWHRSGHDPELGEQAHPPSRLRPGLCPPLAIERDQADGVGVVILDEARAEPACLEPVDQPRQQHGARPVDALERGQVEVDVTAGDQVPLGLLHGPHHRRRVRQVEGASRDQTGALAIGLSPDGHAHHVGLYHPERCGSCDCDAGAAQEFHGRTILMLSARNG